MRSIRSSLLAWILGGLGVVALLSGGAVFLVARHGFRTRLDDVLSTRADNFAEMAVVEDDRLEFDFHGSLREEDLGVILRVSLADGTVLAQSPEWPAECRPPVAALDGPPLLADVSLGSRSGRIVAVSRRATLAGGEGDGGATALPQVIVQVIGRTDSVTRTESALAAALLSGGALAALGTALAVSLGVRRGLAPLRRLGGELDRIDAGCPAASADPREYPQELRPLVTALQGMLARVRAAVDRERRFTDAAAHELRTPLAELRTIADVARLWPEPPRLQRAIADVSTVVAQIESLLECLLAAGRGALAAPGDAGPVPLLPLARTVAEGPRRRVLDRGVSWAIEGDDGARWTGPHGAVAAIVRNLIDNAAEYTPAGGSVRVVAARDNGHVRLEVENGPVQIAPGDVERLFEPFWRADPARPDGHRGLGLSVVAALGDALQLKRSAAVTPDGRLRICLWGAGA